MWKFKLILCLELSSFTSLKITKQDLAATTNICISKLKNFSVKPIKYFLALQYGLSFIVGTPAILFMHMFNDTS